MQDFGEAFRLAFLMMASADPDLMEIVGRSLRVSLSATLISCALGIPIGALVAITRFPGRHVATVIMNALMGLPPVVVGLVVYINLSQAGFFGWMQLLYTPAAMVIAQTILITPIVAALSRQVLADLHGEYDEQFRSLCVPAHIAARSVIWDGRFSLMTVALAGFGRSIAEVGAVIIVGGNIDHLTRVMTTAIALETSRGDLPLAMGLGLILLVISIGVNAAVSAFRLTATRYANA